MFCLRDSLTRNVGTAKATRASSTVDLKYEPPALLKMSGRPFKSYDTLTWRLLEVKSDTPSAQPR
jgi:hypothetical protein